MNKSLDINANSLLLNEPQQTESSISVFENWLQQIDHDRKTPEHLMRPEAKRRRETIFPNGPYPEIKEYSASSNSIWKNNEE